MQEYIKENDGNIENESIEGGISNNIIPDFVNAMDDDFNTAIAISYLHQIFKYVNNSMKTVKKDNKKLLANELAKILKNVKEVYSILGLFSQEPTEFITKMKEKYLKKLDVTEEEISKQIEKRANAKKEKDFETADNIREELDKKGIILNDTINGTTWDIKALYKIV